MNINEINELLKKNISECESDVNYLQLACVSKSKSLSVILNFNKSMTYKDYLGNIYDMLSYRAGKERRYFGLSPNIGAENIVEMIKKLQFKDRKSIEAFISSCPSKFLLRENVSTEVIKELFIRALLQASINFGVVFALDFIIYEKIFELSKENPVFIEGVTYNIKKDKDRYQLILLGYPVEELLLLLDSIGLTTDGKSLFLENKKEKNLSSFYLSDFCNHVILLSSAYYNGVMPRALQLSKLENQYANSKIDTYCFDVELTSFATIQLFDNAKTASHPLLDKELLQGFDSLEDIAQDNFIKQYKKNNLDAINKYLSVSHNSNTIGVSTNITTSDNYLILAKRAEASIDSGTLYCSVNGQSEIYDKDILFYNKSVYEDVPTIDIDKVGRLDFQEEIVREIYAELGMEINAFGGTCEGISALMIDNTNNENITKRRFHFNILFDYLINQTYSEIMHNAKYAVENFENSKFLGLKINKYTSAFNMLCKKAINFLKGIMKAKDIIMTSLTLMLFVMSIKTFGTNQLINKAYSIFNISFSAILLLLTSTNLFSYIAKKIKSSKTRMNISLIMKDYSKKSIDKSIIKCIKKLKNKKYKIHPISLVMIMVLLLKSIKKG